ncbi:hypothetical protein [uncultured Cohaesibacter sp.]|uniref:hypothetical protein n=1 Tax=uncultured Cohaesibacter sp. TaxID=1002546 RepID=UPI0029C61E09|nr:hypothetical protein [uncultured Cohaesibacter sp.]
MSKSRERDEVDDKKKNTSLRLSGKTLKALKIRAIEEDTSVQQIVEKLVEDYLQTPRKTHK